MDGAFCYSIIQIGSFLGIEGEMVLFQLNSEKPRANWSIP